MDMPTDPLDDYPPEGDVNGTEQPQHDEPGLEAGEPAGFSLPREPLPARFLQFAILLFAILLLLGALVGGRIGPVLAGLLVLATAFEPLRRFTDAWLIGDPDGLQANRVVTLRIGVGVLLILMGVFGAFVP